MNKILNIIFVFLVSIIVLSCNNKSKLEKSQNIDKEQLKHGIEKANRYMLIQESELINDYVERHNLNVIETGTGLRYQIIKNGDKKPIEKGDRITLEYEVSLLNGNTVYSSKEDGYKTFVVGKGGVESGLEEAVLLLHKNDVAVLILPAHLAHGLLGDGDRIPAKSTLVYKLKIIDDKSNK